MARDSILYCAECGGRLTLFVVGLCERCTYDQTGEDDSRPHPAEPWPEVEPEK